MRSKYTPKSHIKVSGKMKKRDAGITAKMYASAAIIAALASLVAAISLLLR